MRVADVIHGLSGAFPPQGGQEPITAAVIDSRQAVPGSLFIAFPGSRVDGHDFVADAFARGARLALVQREVPDCPTLDLRRGFEAAAWARFHLPGCLRVENTLAALHTLAAYWRNRLPDLRVVGITGSVGKTSTKELTAQVLAQRYRVLKNPGNYNNEIGLPLTLLHARPEHQWAVLEMGFYVPGDIAKLCALARPVMGVVTNIGLVHAERAGSQQAIVEGKAELVEALPPEGAAVLNFDDPLVRGMAARTRARVFFYGLSPEADLWASDVEGLGLDGIRFVFHYRGEAVPAHLPLLGRHAVHLALRAAAVGLLAGLDWPTVLRGLQAGEAQLRVMTVTTPQGALVIDDTYNAAPQSVLAALNLLADVQGRRKMAVLGDMLELGPYERQGHEKVGLRAAEVVDALVTFGPRARIIAQAARQAGLAPDQVAEFDADEVDALIAHVRAWLGPDDVVLVKGSRGMRMERIVAALEASA